MGCYIWYSDEGTGGRGRSPPRPLLAVPNVTAHLSTAGVLITVLLYDVPLLCGFCVPIKGLNWCRLLTIKFSVSCTVRSCTVRRALIDPIERSYQLFWRNGSDRTSGVSTWGGALWSLWYEMGDLLSPRRRKRGHYAMAICFCLFGRLFVCLSVSLSPKTRTQKTRFFQNLSNLELWSLLTTNRKSYMGFSNNTFLDS